MDFFEKARNVMKSTAVGAEKIIGGLDKIDDFIDAAYKEMGGNGLESTIKRSAPVIKQQENDDAIFSEEETADVFKEPEKAINPASCDQPAKDSLDKASFTESAQESAPVKATAEEPSVASEQSNNNAAPQVPVASTSSKQATDTTNNTAKEEHPSCSEGKQIESSAEEKPVENVAVPVKKIEAEKRVYHDPEDRLHKFCIVKRRVSDAENGIKEEVLEVPSSIIGVLRGYYWNGYRAIVARITDYSYDPENSGEIGFWIIHPNNDLEWKKFRVRMSADNKISKLDEENEYVSKEKQNEIRNELKRLVASAGLHLSHIIHYGGTAEDHSIRGQAMKDGYKDFWIVADWKNWNRPEETPDLAVTSATDLVDYRRKVHISPMEMWQRYWIYLYWNNLLELEKLGTFDISQDMGFCADAGGGASHVLNMFHGQFSNWKIDESVKDRATINVRQAASEETRKKQNKTWDRFEVPATNAAPLLRIYDPEAIKRKQAEEAARKRAEEQKKIAQENARITAENAERKKKEQEERRRAELEEQRAEKYARSGYDEQSEEETDYQPTSFETKKTYKTREANLYVSGSDVDVVLRPGDRIPEINGKVAQKGRTIDNPPQWNSDKRITVRAPKVDEFVYAQYVESYESGNAMFFVDAGSADRLRIIVYGNKNEDAFDDCKVGGYYWIQIKKIKQRDGRRNTYFGRRYRTSMASVPVCANYKRQDYVFGPVSKDENGNLFVWLAPNMRYEIRSEEIANELMLREVNDLGKANYVFRVRAVQKNKGKDGTTALDLRYAEEANLKAIAVERTYSNWNRLPDPDEDEIIFKIGDKFLDWINDESGQELACAIIKFHDDEATRFRRVKKWEVKEWFLNRYWEAYADRRIHLRERNGRLEGDFELGVFNKKGVPQSLKFFIPPDDYCSLIPIKFGFVSVENTFSDLVYEPNWQKFLKPLSDLILKGEEWDYANTKNTQSEKYILRSYVIFAFYKAWLDGSIIESEHGAIFNTGLVDRRYEDIYCYLKFNSHEDDFFCRQWEIGGFNTEEALIEKFPDLPKRTIYIGVNNIGDVYLDVDRKLGWNYKHILGERLYRFPMKFLKRTLSGYKEAVEICEQIENDEATIDDLQAYVNNDTDAYDALWTAFNAAIRTALKFVEWDYRTCVTCYYARSNSLSLLLPIRLDRKLDSRPDLTLVIERTPQGTYYGHTVLSLAMAYQDARQIGRPASDWLIPSYIESLEEDDEDRSVEFESSERESDEDAQHHDDAEDQDGDDVAGEEEE